MGSSAGAGSGEFHVYRHLRRKEYARQKQIQEQSKKVFRQTIHSYSIPTYSREKCRLQIGRTKRRISA